MMGLDPKKNQGKFLPGSFLFSTTWSIGFDNAPVYVSILVNRLTTLVVV